MIVRPIVLPLVCYLQSCHFTHFCRCWINLVRVLQIVGCTEPWRKPEMNKMNKSSVGAVTKLEAGPYIPAICFCRQSPGVEPHIHHSQACLVCAPTIPSIVWCIHTGGAAYVRTSWQGPSLRVFTFSRARNKITPSLFATLRDPNPPPQPLWDKKRTGQGVGVDHGLKSPLATKTNQLWPRHVLGSAFPSVW